MSYLYIAVDRLTLVNFRTLDYITVDTSKLYFIFLYLQSIIKIYQGVRCYAAMQKVGFHGAHDCHFIFRFTLVFFILLYVC